MWRTEIQEVKHEFQLVHFRLLYSNAGDFAETPWFGVPVILVYRLVVAIYCSAWIIYSGSHPSNGHEKWFIYLTNWSFLLMTVYFVSATLITAFYYREECKQGEYEISSPEPIPLKSRNGISHSSDIDSREKSREEIHGSREKTEARETVREKGRSHEEVKVSINPLEVMQEIPMSRFHEALWVIYNIAANTALLVTVTNLDYKGYQVDGLIITTQILNTVFILVETLLGTVPVRLCHVIYPMLFTIFYVMGTVVYWASNGKNTTGEPFVYSVIDYSGNPKQSIGTILGFFFLGHPLAQLVLFIVSRVRYWLGRKFSKKLIW